jgi:hypothetical protein
VCELIVGGGGGGGSFFCQIGHASSVSNRRISRLAMRKERFLMALVTAVHNARWLSLGRQLQLSSRIERQHISVARG